MSDLLIEKKHMDMMKYAMNKINQLPKKERVLADMMRDRMYRAWGYMSASDKPDPIAALCDPDKNIRYGAAHLAALIKGRPITAAVIRDVAGKYNGAGSDSAYARNVCALWRKYEEAIQ